MEGEAVSVARASASAVWMPRGSFWLRLEVLGAWLLALVWLAPLIYAFWAAFHPPAYATRFELFAPLTLENFAEAWSQAPSTSSRSQNLSRGIHIALARATLTASPWHSRAPLIGSGSASRG